MAIPRTTTDSPARHLAKQHVWTAVLQALRAAFIPRRMRCLWTASLVAALVVNPYVLNDGQSVLMSCMGIVCSASLLCGVILLCLKYRFTAYAVLPAVILFNAGLYMMQMRYGVTLSLSVLASIAETNFQEACAFCTVGSHSGNAAAGRLYLPGHLLEPPFPSPDGHMARPCLHLGPLRRFPSFEYSGRLLQRGTPLPLLYFRQGEGLAAGRFCNGPQAGQRIRRK